MRTIAGAIRRMHDIGDEIGDEKDGVWCFNELYTLVTTKVDERVRQGHYFADNRFLTELDVAFANRYFDALRAAARGHVAPRSWMVLIASRHQRDLCSMQFATAGVNAHINFDLPFALRTACDKLGQRLGEGTQHRDYVLVNDIFAELYGTFRDRFFESEEFKRLDAGAGRVAMNLVSKFAVKSGRALAWENAWILEQAHEADKLLGQVGLEDKKAEAIDRSTWYAGDLLLTGLN